MLNIKVILNYHNALDYVISFVKSNMATNEADYQ